MQDDLWDWVESYIDVLVWDAQSNHYTLPRQ